MNNRKKSMHWLSKNSFYGNFIMQKAIHNGFRTIDKRCKLNNPYILDAGCGHGSLTRELLENIQDSDSIYGCDIDQEALNFCRNMNPQINYFTQDLLLPIKGEQKFDLIICTTALAQFKNTEQDVVINNLVNKLQPNGLLWIVDVNSSNTNELFAKLISKYTVILNENFSKFFFGKYCSIFYAEMIPYPILMLLEIIIPGKKILKQLIISKNK